MLTATVSYIPWWYKTAEESAATAAKGLSIVEQGYDVAARLNDGVPLEPTAAPDGGFSSLYTPVLKILPAPPLGFTWSYGKNTAGVAPWNGLHWFCLKTSDVNEGSWRGLRRLRAVYSPEQLVMATSCGATSNISLQGEAPSELALTLYVAYVPGVSK